MKNIKYILAVLFILIVISSFFFYYYGKQSQTTLTPLTHNKLTSISGEKNTQNNEELVEYSYIFVGDTGSGDKNQYAVADSIAKHCAKFYCVGVFLLGDNFYSSGVTSVDDIQWQTKFEVPYGLDRIKAMKYVTLGNHDYEGCVQCQVDYTNKNTGWYLPNTYWTLEKEQESFFILDTEKITESQLNELQEYLLKKPETIVLGHRPLYTNEISHYEENFTGKDKLKKILCDSKSTYISGHAHVMEYFESLPQCGVRQIVIGSGGAVLRGFVDNPKIISDFSRSEYGFASLDMKNGQGTLSFWNTENIELIRKEW